MRKSNKVPLQALLEGDYLRVYRMHKELNDLSAIPHRHDHYELMMITGGKGDHAINFKQYPFKVNRVYFIHPGQVHTINEFERDGILILFGETIMQRFLTLHKSEDHFGLLDPFTDTPFVDLDAPSRELYQSILPNIQQELKARQPDEAILFHYVSLLLLAANRRFTQQHTDTKHSTKEREISSQLKRLVEAYYKQEHGVAFYVKKMNLPIKQLNKYCSLTSGLSLYALIQERCLIESKILLQVSALSAKEISYQLGFKDPAYFGRFFKKHTGLTPVGYRAQVALKYQS
ncbi:AraC-like DNA-binding protein [Chitinophaga skermanii]|uniref:AraC-like DNA-binding protein n=1 Tax=Chitinophaga skermanii TaxID=331697 RepID=A0A327QY81_9BACT|nr:helix-turn-helix domain-containing protein [Chitinophaga skermanii]RAJ08572.1 AraC-like DNA-binding protein [Chitinophaga skermanii]